MKQSANGMGIFVETIADSSSQVMGCTDKEKNMNKIKLQICCKWEEVYNWEVTKDFKL